LAGGGFQTGNEEEICLASTGESLNLASGAGDSVAPAGAGATIFIGTGG
jgi:hypothetical protein